MYLRGSRITKNSQHLIPTEESLLSRIKRFIGTMIRRLESTSTTARYTSTDQKPLKQNLPNKKNQKKVLRKKKMTPYKSMLYSRVPKGQFPPPYRRLPFQRPQPLQAVRFLETPEVNHSSQVRFLHHPYPKDQYYHPDLPPDPVLRYPPPLPREPLQSPHSHLSYQPNQVLRYPQYPHNQPWPRPLHHALLEPPPSHSQERVNMPFPSGIPSRTTTTPIMMPSLMTIRRSRPPSHTLKSEPRLGTGQVTVWPPPYRPTPLPMGHGHSSRLTSRTSSSCLRLRPKPSSRYIPLSWETETSTSGTRSGASSLDDPVWMTNRRCSPFERT